MKKKVLSLLLAGILTSQLFTGISPVQASESGMPNPVEMTGTLEAALPEVKKEPAKEAAQEQEEPSEKAAQEQEEPSEKAAQKQEEPSEKSAREQEEHSEKAAQKQEEPSEKSAQKQEEHSEHAPVKIIQTEYLADFQNAVLKQRKEQNIVLSEQEQPFATRTLVVFAQKQFETKGAASHIRNKDGLNVLFYETKQDTKAAYEYLKGLEGTEISYVVTDDVLYVAEDTKTASAGVELIGAGTTESIPEPESEGTASAENSGTVDNSEIAENSKTVDNSEIAENSKTVDNSEIAENSGAVEKSLLQSYIEENRTDAGVRVAVLDTGVDKTTEWYKELEQQGRVLDTAWSLSTDGEPWDMQDTHGHGTAMVSLLAGMTGENIKLLPLKIADSKGRATVLSAYLAICSAMKLQSDVILLSMNGIGESSPLLKSVIEQAVEQGILVVVSAGNAHTDTLQSAPADVREALVVSAIEKGEWTEYSNEGQTVDFCAEGSYSYMEEDGTKQTVHGTSYAAARVAAMGAELRTFLENAQAVEEVFLAYAQDLGESGFDIYYGNGYLGETKAGKESVVNPVEKPEEGPVADSQEETPENIPGSVPENISGNVPETADGAENDVPKPKPQGNVPEAADGVENGVPKPQGNVPETADGAENDVPKPQDELVGLMEAECFTWHPQLPWDELPASRITAKKGHHVKYCNSKKTHTEFKWVKKETGKWTCSCGGTLDSFAYLYQYTCNGKAKTAAEVELHHCAHPSHPHATVFINGNPETALDWTQWDQAKEDFALNAAKEKIKNNITSVACEGYLVKNKYTVAYDAKGGTGSVASATVNYGDEHTISTTQLLRTGYRFQGYYIKRESDEKIWGGTNGWLSENAKNEEKYKLYQCGATITVGSSLVSDDLDLLKDTFTLTAKWEKRSYTIKYHGNGASSGSIKGTTVAYGESFTIAKNSFVWPGHTYKGFYVKRKSDGKIYCGSTKKWQSPANVTEGDYKLYQENASCTMKTSFVRAAKEYDGNDTFTFYAKWDTNSYTVTYQANGATGGTIHGTTGSVATKTVAWGTPVPLDVVAVPKDNSLTFVGWSATKTGKPVSSLLMGDKNITLYAVYSPPVSDVKEVYLLLSDKNGKVSKNGRKVERYQLEKTAAVNQPVKGYRYKLSKIDYKKLFPDSAAADIQKKLVSVDYAGNISTYGAGAAPPKYYNQTVLHLFQNLDTGQYEDIGDYRIPGSDKIITTRTDILVESGKQYTPDALKELPKGYRFNSTKSTGAGKPYTVTGAKSTSIYYDAIPYTLHFQLNGGTASAALSKAVYTGKSYDYLPGGKHTGFPNAVKKGYSLEGWYTENTGGKRVYPSTEYTLTADSTIYARWRPNAYQVTYDYWTNGGTAAWKTEGQTSYTDSVAHGGRADLKVSAKKEGWVHVGWSLSPDATTALTTPPVINGEDLVLYAVYKRDITTTFVDRNDSGIQRKTMTYTLYNREVEITVAIPKQNTWTSWNPQGWCPVEDGIGQPPAADVPAALLPGTTVTIKNNTTFYGRYYRDITVSYDTNGSPQQIQPEVKKRYYNASDAYLDPEFIVAQGPTLPNNSFVCWIQEKRDAYGNPVTKEYTAGQHVVFREDALLVAKWDEYPEIEAYDRYFTLQQAQAGEITPEVLLEKVKGTDAEDGALVNGTDVTVVDYRAEEFKSFSTEGGVSVTYRAADSFGNMTEKMIMAYIVDTAVKENIKQEYVRFISSRFFKVGNQYVEAEAGGVEENSVWKKRKSFAAALEQALINETATETWKFHREKIKEIQAYLRENGFGNYRQKNGIAEYLQKFSGCRE